MNMQDLRNDVDNELNGSEYAIHGGLREIRSIGQVVVDIGKINHSNEREDITRSDMDRLKQLLVSIEGFVYSRLTQCQESTLFNENCHNEILARFIYRVPTELALEFHGDNEENKCGIEITGCGILDWYKVEMNEIISTEMMISKDGLRTITIHHQSVPLDKAYFVIVYERLNEKLLSYSPECEFGSETRLINNVIKSIERSIGEKL